MIGPSTDSESYMYSFGRFLHYGKKIRHTDLQDDSIITLLLPLTAQTSQEIFSTEY